METETKEIPVLEFIDTQVDLPTPGFLATATDLRETIMELASIKEDNMPTYFAFQEVEQLKDFALALTEFRERVYGELDRREASQ